MTAAKKNELEAWENISRSRHYITKTDRRGELATEMVGGKKTFYISETDRQINMERAANEKLDPFRNGQFSPVRLLDGTEDKEEIAANPNLIGEADMAKLVKGPIGKLKDKLAEIDNPIVVNRLADIARDQDATVKKVEAIDARIAELKPSTATHVERVA